MSPKRIWLSVLCGCGLALATSAPAQSYRARDLAALTDSLRHLMQRQHMPGLMVGLVTRDSVLWAGGLGVANRAPGQPVGPHTRFRLGSLTKTMLAVGLLRLVDAGRLSLQDELHRVAPEVPFVNPWEKTHPVRIRHLLEHTAGFHEITLNQIYDHSPTRPRGLAAVRRLEPTLHCRWRPGERSSYSNPGYVVVAYLLEKYSGLPYAQYLTQTLVRPLALPDATFDFMASGPAVRSDATGYLFRNGAYLQPPRLPVFAEAAGALNASTVDMSRWLQFFLRDFRAPNGAAIIRAHWRASMEQSETTLAARAGQPNGYGMGVYARNADMPTFYGHGSYIDGFISAMGYSAELGVGYVLANNGGQPLAEAERFVQQFLTHHQPPRPLPTAPPTDLRAMQPFLGVYYDDTPLYTRLTPVNRVLNLVRVYQQDNLLLMRQFPGGLDTLQALGPRVFRINQQHLPSVAFAHDASGQPVLMRLGQYYAPAGRFWWWRPLSVLGPLFLLALSVLVVVGWGIRYVAGWTKDVPRWPAWLPAFSASALGTGVLALAHLAGNLWLAGTFNGWTLLLYVASLMFGGSALLGAGGLLWHWRRLSRWLAVYLLFTYAALLWLVVMLAQYGWIGLRLWA